MAKVSNPHACRDASRVFIASAAARITIALARRITQHGAAIARQPTDGLFLCAGGKLAGMNLQFSLATLRAAVRFGRGFL